MGRIFWKVGFNQLKIVWITRISFMEIESSEFQDLLQQLSPKDFERFVADLLRRRGLFSDVHLENMMPDRGVDVVALELGSSRKWYFQIKRVKVIGLDVADYMGQIAQRLRLYEPNVEIVLVVSGSATQATLATLKKRNIHLWDASTLLGFVTPDLLEEYFGTKPSWTKLSLIPDRNDSLRLALQQLDRGRRTWSEYQRLVADILEYLFCPPLQPPRYEINDIEIRNRRDIIFENSAGDELWSQLRAIYSAHYIVVDAKNYEAALNKSPVLDIAHYLKPYGCGMFALLVSREGAGPAAQHAIREQWIGASKMIVSLADSDLIEMLTLKKDGGKPEEIVRRLIADFRIGL